MGMKISLLINMKMPTIVGIFIYISRVNFMLSWIKHEKSFITSDASLFPHKAPDKGHPLNSFLIFLENICCGYTLKATQQGTSDEYPHTFSLRSKKNIKNHLSVPDKREIYYYAPAIRRMVEKPYSVTLVRPSVRQSISVRIRIGVSTLCLRFSGVGNLHLNFFR